MSAVTTPPTPADAALRAPLLDARRHAFDYVTSALEGALDMSDYDPVAMRWSKAEHLAVIDEVRAITTDLKRRALNERRARARELKKLERGGRHVD